MVRDVFGRFYIIVYRKDDVTIRFSFSVFFKDMDTVYPEPIRLRLSTASRRHRGAGQDRYRTQPVTFSEIKVNIKLVFNIRATIFYSCKI